MRSATRKKVGKDPAYLEFIAGLPCAVCLNGAQKSRTEVAHVGARGLSQKCHDEFTAPLCAEHHRTGKDAHHVLGKKFFKHHGIDMEALIARLKAAYQLINNAKDPQRN